MRICRICGKRIRKEEYKTIPESLIPNLCYHHFKTKSRMQKAYIESAVPNNIDLLLDRRSLPRTIFDYGEEGH